mmetsp:Transcript_27654/g.79840  ORF Transcript_27654/g.79840 Transcript_27654/m.79840 type:complete len:253 (+) Transcript_27654:201-959(+)
MGNLALMWHGSAVSLGMPRKRRWFMPPRPNCQRLRPSLMRKRKMMKSQKVIMRGLTVLADNSRSAWVRVKIGERSIRGRPGWPCSVPMWKREKSISFPTCLEVCWKRTAKVVIHSGNLCLLPVARVWCTLVGMRVEVDRCRDALDRFIVISDLPSCILRVSRNYSNDCRQRKMMDLPTRKTTKTLLASRRMIVLLDRLVFPQRPRMVRPSWCICVTRRDLTHMVGAWSSIRLIGTSSRALLISTLVEFLSRR